MSAIGCRLAAPRAMGTPPMRSGHRVACPAVAYTDVASRSGMRTRQEKKNGPFDRRELRPKGLEVPSPIWQRPKNHRLCLLSRDDFPVGPR